MKTKEQLNKIKEEVETLNKKLAELTDEELAQVIGGKYEDIFGPPPNPDNDCIYNFHFYGGKVQKDFEEPKW